MLRNLQRRFLEGIFDRDEAVLEQIRGGERLSAGEHLAIYRGSVFGILCQALAEIYPVCQRLVGAKFFDALCQRFIVTHRPTSHNLQGYGVELPDFLDGFTPVNDLPYLADVARLEWAWHRAFHAADESGFDIHAFSALTPERQATSILRLPASATLLQSEYPIDRIWQVNQPEWSRDACVDLDEGGCRLLVWRRGYDMHIERLEASHWELLGVVQQGVELAKLSDPDRFPDLDRLLPEAIARGWIAGVADGGSG